MTDWVRKFKSGYRWVMDEDNEWSLSTVVAEDNFGIVKELVLQDRRITIKQLSSETGISLGSI